MHPSAAGGGGQRRAGPGRRQLHARARHAACEAAQAVGEPVQHQIEPGAGAQLVILDASQYFGDPGTVSQFLRDVSVAHGFGYVPLGEALREANRSGVVTRWDYDAHFNEAGHEVMAKALVEFLARAPARSSDARIAARTRG